METKPTPPVLIEVTRGPAVESRHRGQIVVIDAQGNLKHQIGDPEVLVCLRSLAKPFQALAVVTSGAAEAFGFKGAELALFSGSLSGQDFQTFLVTSCLERLGLKPGGLAMRRSPAPAQTHGPGPGPGREASPAPSSTPAPASTPPCWPSASITAGPSTIT